MDHKTQLNQHITKSQAILQTTLFLNVLQLELFAADSTARKFQFKPLTRLSSDCARKRRPNYEKLTNKIRILQSKSYFFLDFHIFSEFLSGLALEGLAIYVPQE